MSVDRLPPQSLEAEQSVLGAVLIDRDAIIEVADILRPADFYRQANGTIFGAMLELWERREPIDIVTVAEALERAGNLETIGGRGYLSSLSEQTPTAVFAAQYARIVERKAVLRNLSTGSTTSTRTAARSAASGPAFRISTRSPPASSLRTWSSSRHGRRSARRAWPSTLPSTRRSGTRPRSRSASSVSR